MLKLTARDLTKAEQQQIVEEKLNWILANSTPLKIILFGSGARNEMKESSDIDLILIFSDRETLSSSQIRLNKTRRKGDWPQDLLFHTCESYETSVASGGGAGWLAEKEGKIIYERAGASK